MHSLVVTLASLSALCLVGCIERDRLHFVPDAPETVDSLPDVDGAEPPDSTDVGVDDVATDSAPDTAEDATPPGDTDDEVDVPDDRIFAMTTDESALTFFPGRALRRPLSATVFEVDASNQRTPAAGVAVSLQVRLRDHGAWATLNAALMSDVDGRVDASPATATMGDITTHYRLAVTSTLSEGDLVAVEFTVRPTRLRFFATGVAHACAATRDELFCWGYNGLLTEDNQPSGDHPMSTAVDVTAGNGALPRVDAAAQVPLPNGAGSSVLTLPPGSEITGVAVAGDINATDPQPIGTSTCVSIVGDEPETTGVWCVGSNANSRLANSGNAVRSDAWTRVRRIAAPNPAPIPAAFALVAGANHFCALVNDEQTVKTYCWGSAEAGQTGIGAREPNPLATHVRFDTIGAFTPSQLAAGRSATCAIGTIANPFGGADTQPGPVCWGLNTAGQFGTDTTDGASLPSAFNTLSACNADPDTVVGFVNHRTMAVGVGERHSCAVVATERVGTTTESEADELCRVDTTTPQVVCAGANDSGQRAVLEGALPLVSWAAATPFTQQSVGTHEGVTAGHAFNCSWSSSGRVYCWGDSAHGQLGDTAGSNTTTSRFVQMPLGSVVSRVVAGPRHACALTYPFGGDPEDVTIVCWGDNTFGQSGNGCVASPDAPGCAGGTVRTIDLR